MDGLNIYWHRTKLAVDRWHEHRRISRQIQVSASAKLTLTPASWSGSTLPTVNALTRVYKDFVPERIVLTELISATWASDKDEKITRAAVIADAADLCTERVFIGEENCLSDSYLASLADHSLGHRKLLWPVFRKLHDLSVDFRIEESALHQIASPDEEKYGALPKELTVSARLIVFGKKI